MESMGTQAYHLVPHQAAHLAQAQLASTALAHQAARIRAQVPLTQDPHTLQALEME